MKHQNNVQSIINALTYVNKFCNKTMLIKLGGSILYDDQLIQSLCHDLKLLKGVGIKIILVHGGSKAINQALASNNIESQFIDGLRVTSKEAMKIIEKILCEQINNLIVRKLNNLGVGAVGLSGADDNMLQADYYSENHGYAGVIKKVNIAVLTSMLGRQGTYRDSIPVIAPVGIDDQGNALNINADWAASALACHLKADKLIYLTDQDGIYDNNGKIIVELAMEQLNKLIINKIVTGGMLVKTQTILAALNANIDHIHVLNGTRSHVLIEELFTVSGIGTLCKKFQEVKKSDKVTYD